MICQVCKNRLPFQLDDGTDYFERVEFLPALKRHHKQNYLALSQPRCDVPVRQRLD